MHRRAFLAAVGSVSAACAGCLGADQPPILLRAMPATGNETDIECPLSESFVADHPSLQTVLTQAADRPNHEWARVGVSVETANDISDALHHHCEAADTQDGGLYHFRGSYYFISITPRGTSTAGLEQAHDG